MLQTQHTLKDWHHSRLHLYSQWLPPPGHTTVEGWCLSTLGRIGDNSKGAACSIMMRAHLGQRCRR